MTIITITKRLPIFFLFSSSFEAEARVWPSARHLPDLRVFQLCHACLNPLLRLSLLWHPAGTPSNTPAHARPHTRTHTHLPSTAPTPAAIRSHNDHLQDLVGISHGWEKLQWSPFSTKWTKSDSGAESWASTAEISKLSAVRIIADFHPSSFE